MRRRRPGQSKLTTQRDESDAPEIWSGVFEGKTDGTPIGILFRNSDQRSGDYGDIKDKYRPGHADYTFDAKYGFRDYRGGGRSSARETVCRVAAGAVAKKLLARDGIRAVDADLAEAAARLLAELVDDEHELVTIIEGEGASDAVTRHMVVWLEQHRPDVGTEVHHGGQPLYPYLIGIE